MISAKYNRIVATLAILLGCTRVPDDVSLTLRQVAWPGPRAVEVKVTAQHLEITATIQGRVVDHRLVRITTTQSNELRHLFWRSWENQPATRRVPRLVDGVLVEQFWQGPERTWHISTRGPLTGYEKSAFTYLNRLLPTPYRFPLRLGFRQE